MIHCRITWIAMLLCLASTCLADDRAELKPFIESNCLECHDQTNPAGGLTLGDVLVSDIGRHADVWEKVVRKLASRQMPPHPMPRPAEASYDKVVARLESELDAAAASNPNPGRTESLRRLTRTEYRNAIRDLLALDIDVQGLLPPDESSHGFDNITVADLSPTLLNRYLSAAQKISRQAMGGTSQIPAGETFRVRPDITQDTHLEGTPLGMRGGTVIHYDFPQNGEYEIQVRLMRDRNETIEGLREAHEMDVLLDGQRRERFTIRPPQKGSDAWSDARGVDSHLNTRVATTAGPHKLVVAFVTKSASLLETPRQPLNVHFNYYRHPRIGPAVYQVSIVGPIASTSQAELHSPDTPSRRRIFGDDASGDEAVRALRILSNLMRQAYRRPVDAEDLQTPLARFQQARAEGSFDDGIEAALGAILASPHFLLRIERDPPDAPPAAAYRISDLELASRLSFFLWGSIPDEALLDLAARNELSRPETLAKQVQRMLADERSRSLVTNFARQWLHLGNLESFIPDMRLFPDFDDNLRQALRQETELFFESILDEDRSVLDLIRADETFLNERLAKHYGIPHVYGSRFRRVTVDAASHRGGLLRHGSILAVTSYATRTSPVIRGNWVLANLLGTPAPPPPDNVPALKDNTVSSTLSVRERLTQHRADAACASCHQLMDPIGFALENYDALGRWRETDAGQPIDASGGLPDGSQFAGVDGLEQALLARPELFVRTLTEKLLTYALGRGIETYDAPAIRRIVRDARADEYRLSRLIAGIVASVPFQMRRSP